MIALKELFKKYPSGILLNPDVATIEVSTNGLDKCDISIKPLPNQDWNFNSEVELVCYWYYGSLLRGIKEEIESAFANNNYEQFCKARDRMFNQAGSWCFPRSVSLYWKDEIIGWIDFIDEFIFDNIDFQECEHG